MKIKLQKVYSKKTDKNYIALFIDNVLVTFDMLVISRILKCKSADVRKLLIDVDEYPLN